MRLPLLSRGLIGSFAAHLALLLFLFLKSLVFPSNPIPYIPSLRVDIVGLPEILKKDLSRVSPAKPSNPKAEVTEPTEKPEEPITKEELILNPKKIGKRSRTASKPHENAKENKEEKKDRRKKALARIKALNRIQTEDETESPPLAGNTISPGSTVTGNARETTQAQYLDAVLARVQENWEIPTFLAKQNLSAQVQIFIDSVGRLRGTRFIRNSGNELFDSAVQQALQRSTPFPPPPQGFAMSALTNGILLGFPL